MLLSKRFCFVFQNGMCLRNFECIRMIHWLDSIRLYRSLWPRFGDSSILPVMHLRHRNCQVKLWHNVGDNRPNQVGQWNPPHRLLAKSPSTFLLTSSMHSEIIQGPFECLGPQTLIQHKSWVDCIWQCAFTENMWWLLGWTCTSPDQAILLMYEQKRCCHRAHEARETADMYPEAAWSSQKSRYIPWYCFTGWNWIIARSPTCHVRFTM